MKSQDNQNWGSPVAVGTYFDDAKLKTTIFTPGVARYVKITSLSEAGNRGSFVSIAEVNVYDASNLPPSPATAGSWGLTVDLPLVPVSAAIEWATGRLVVWSSFSWNGFVGDSGHKTVTAIYDPASQTVTPRTVTNTDHDMFCEGLSMDADGRIVAAGGNSDRGVSIYDSTADTWSDGAVSTSDVPLSIIHYCPKHFGLNKRNCRFKPSMPYLSWYRAWNIADAVL